jgi:sec-independent protein translocase protein TatB
MFDLGWPELLVVAAVALIVIGPKDLPVAMRWLGRWVGKARAMTRHVRAGFDEMVRQAELEDMEKEWKRHNEEIMKATAALPDLDLHLDDRGDARGDARGDERGDEGAPGQLSDPAPQSEAQPATPPMTDSPESPAADPGAPPRGA